MNEFDLYAQRGETVQDLLRDLDTAPRYGDVEDDEEWWSSSDSY